LFYAWLSSTLMWFAGALRTTLPERKRWLGRAGDPPLVRPPSAFLFLIAMVRGLAYSIAGSGKSHAHIGADTVPYGWLGLTRSLRAMLIMAAAVWTLAGPADVELALRVGGRGGRARLASGTTWAERRILAPGRRLFALRLARRRLGVGLVVSRCSGPEVCYTCWW